MSGPGHTFRFRLTGTCAVVAVGVLLAAAAASGGALKEITYTPGAAGAGDPYFPLDGNGGYDTDHYLLDLRYDPATDTLDGTATIEARATQNLSRFNLDLEGLTVHSVQVNDRVAVWSRDGGELTITPSEGIRERKRFTTKIAYSGVPETIVDALRRERLPAHRRRRPRSSGSRTSPTRGTRSTTIRATRRPIRSGSPCRPGSRRSRTACSRTRPRAAGGRRGRGTPASRWRPT